MVVRHRKKIRVPADLAPELVETLEQTAKEYNIPRTQLIRIFIKYGLSNVKEALKYGDRILWDAPALPSSKDTTSKTDNFDIDKTDNFNIDKTDNPNSSMESN